MFVAGLSVQLGRRICWLGLNLELTWYRSTLRKENQSLLSCLSGPALGSAWHVSFHSIFTVALQTRKLGLEESKKLNLSPSSRA